MILLTLPLVGKRDRLATGTCRCEEGTFHAAADGQVSFADFISNLHTRDVQLQELVRLVLDVIRQLRVIGHRSFCIIRDGDHGCLAAHLNVRNSEQAFLCIDQ